MRSPETGGSSLSASTDSIGHVIDGAWWWTRTEVATAFGVHADAIRKWESAGQLPNARALPGDRTGKRIVAHADLLASGRLEQGMTPQQFASRIRSRLASEEVTQLRNALQLAQHQLAQLQQSLEFWQGQATRLSEQLDQERQVWLRHIERLHSVHDSVQGPEGSQAHSSRAQAWPPTGSGEPDRPGSE